MLKLHQGRSNLCKAGQVWVHWFCGRLVVPLLRGSSTHVMVPSGCNGRSILLSVRHVYILIRQCSCQSNWIMLCSLWGRILHNRARGLPDVDLQEFDMT